MRERDRDRETERNRNGKSNVSVSENRCCQLCMMGSKVLLNLREFGFERGFVVGVEVLAGLRIRCVLMVEKKGK
jgi:hypothetical protein